ncbi:MAG: hypothetical protein IKB70_08205 [Bacilli bacterium]|nr:hypothetical protein [Bacilli bacterium]
MTRFELIDAFYPILSDDACPIHVKSEILQIIDAIVDRDECVKIESSTNVKVVKM